MSHNLQELSQSVDRPRWELIRQSGWTVNAMHGSYCVVWRGQEEVVLAWHDGQWRQVSGRSGGAFQSH